MTSTLSVSAGPTTNRLSPRSSSTLLLTAFFILTSACSSSGPDAGTDLADAGTDLADSGTDLADAGTDLAEAGTDLADAGTDLADLGTDLPFDSTGDEPGLATVDELLAAIEAGDGGPFFDLMERYDGPACDPDGRCLVITFLELTDHVFVRGEFNDWGKSGLMTPVEFAPGFFYFLLEGYQFSHYVSYRLYDEVGGGENWYRDPLNRYVRFSDVELNSAIYAHGKSRIAIVEAIYSPQLDNTRHAYIYVPGAAFLDPSARFPVLYMQDGANVFDNPKAMFGTWDVNFASDELVDGGAVEPLIIVGVLTNNRFDEYLYCAITIDLGVPVEVDPKLDEYAAFLVDTLKPVVDDAFPTLDGANNTGIAGSSLGGISSLYIGWKYPGVFGKVGSMSGSYWVGESGTGTVDAPSIREVINSAPPTPEQLALKIYLDSGDSGGGGSSYPSDGRVFTDWVRNTLIALGFPNRPEWDDDGDLATPPMDFPQLFDPANVPTLFWADPPPAQYSGWDEYLRPDLNLLHLVGPGHQHNEAAWKARFPAMVRYLFSPP